MTQVTVYPPGVPVTATVPGDFGLTHGSSFVSRAIQLGQGFRFRGERRPFAHWNHAFLVTGDNGEIVQATGHGIARGSVHDYDVKEVHLVHVDISDADRAEMVAYAHDSIGQCYGYLTIVSIALQLVSGLHLAFEVASQLICSAFVAEALVMAGYTWHVDTAFVTPADLAARFGVLP